MPQLRAILANFAAQRRRVAAEIRRRQRRLLLAALLAACTGIIATMDWWYSQIVWLLDARGSWWPLVAFAIVVVVVATPMRSRKPSKRSRAPRWLWLLSDQGIGATVLIVAALGTAAMIVLLAVASGANINPELTKLRLDAIKYGLGAVASAGAIGALLLALRRQRHAEEDAVEKHVTELYTKAVEHLGHSQAPVRLGALHALERVAQNNESQRQTVVDVICSYLRMPFDSAPVVVVREQHGTPQDGSPPAQLGTERDPVADQQYLQEYQVRLAAQRILSRHLTASSRSSEHARADQFWPNISVDLSGARLFDVDFSDCHVDSADFSKVTFEGECSFHGTEFAGTASFQGSLFRKFAFFVEATFNAWADFGGATFEEGAKFIGADFRAGSWFASARFDGLGGFHRCTFHGEAQFAGSTFNIASFSESVFHVDHGATAVDGKGRAGFDGALFGQETAFFGGAVFRGKARFSGATFIGGAWFEKATFEKLGSFDDAVFGKYCDFAGADFRKVDLDRTILTEDFESASEPIGWRIEKIGPNQKRFIRDEQL